MKQTLTTTSPVYPPPIPRSPLLAGRAELFLFAGAASADAATYSSPGTIDVPGYSVANPYPAPINVTGLTGTVTDVNVRLNNLTHGTIDDVAVAVQAPNGQSMMLMSGVGRFQVTDATLTIDDEAAHQFESEVNPTTGSYRPAQFYTSDTFPAPGPGSSACNPGPVAGGSCTLASSFDGSNPIGTWKLWVVDHLGTSSGQIAGGWSLDIQTTGGTDFAAPQTTIDSGPSGTIDTASAAFTFSASEQAAFECKLDGGWFASCTSPAIYGGLADGAHTFAVRATDPAGNVDATPATRSFTVGTATTPTDPNPADPSDPTNPNDGPRSSADTIAPKVAVAEAKVKRAKRSATIAFVATDETTNAAQLITTCALDGGAATPCSSPATFKRLKPGRHSVEVRATDAAGNRSDAAAVMFKVKRKR
jgi:subtilisin-like proprotein convertase family protein